MTKTPTTLKCLRCAGPVTFVVEEDIEPPWRENRYHVCEKCGEHHVLHSGKFTTRNYEGPVLDVSQEEADIWRGRGGCRRLCGRAFPWEVA